jgi:hypothetical protein
VSITFTHSTKVDGKIITEESGDALWKRIAELEKENSQLKVIAAEL